MYKVIKCLIYKESIPEGGVTQMGVMGLEIMGGETVIGPAEEGGKMWAGRPIAAAW